ncbi:MAG: DUF805 domain-containing protein [Deltaproteobacteria bacterium]|jgi:uncharacterized membrane protein YhaH (DUF805 family)|nr:DUF805 domain-containing protein [Deltaproteobacteria bacterium]
MWRVFHAWDNRFKATGRAGRKEYWLFALFLLVTYALAAVAVFDVLALLDDRFGREAREVVTDIALALVEQLFIVMSAVAFLLMICLSIRRLHDIGLPGWVLVPALLLPVVMLVFALIRGKDSPNRYGPPRLVPRRSSTREPGRPRRLPAGLSRDRVGAPMASGRDAAGSRPGGLPRLPSRHLGVCLACGRTC